MTVGDYYDEIQSAEKNIRYLFEIMKNYTCEEDFNYQTLQDTVVFLKKYINCLKGVKVDAQTY